MYTFLLSVCMHYLNLSSSRIEIQSTSDYSCMKFVYFIMEWFASFLYLFIFKENTNPLPIRLLLFEE